MGTLREKGTADPSDAAAVLFGRTRRRVLGWLLGHADEAFYLRQLVRHAGVGQGAVQRELDRLTRAGLLRRTVQGRQVYFQANRASPIFPELHALFLKTAGMVDVLREALAPVAARVLVAFVFGSAARGALRADSDLDVLLVGEVPFESVASALAEAQARLGRDVNPTVYPPDEFRAKLRAGHHFLTTVLREARMFVIGVPDELAGLGTPRVADHSPDQPKRNPRSPRRRDSRPRRQRR
ncbi:MAG: nucleotidyltransferase domain-containing protein [Candidatus Rokuibacteriota bacterium]